MRSNRTIAAALCLGLVPTIHGCASCPPCAKAAERCADQPVATTSGGTSAPTQPPESAAPASTVSAAPEAPPVATTEPAPVPAPSSPNPVPQSLPEVEVHNVGLHIGGGPNDDATKAPFLKAIESHFDAFRGCYVKVEEPEKGGTFGVDLHIGREGGKAEVKQPRTGMKGTEFRNCVVRVFEGIEFGKPKKGPTVISYSIRYALKK